MVFPPPHINHPQTTHTNTIILLHGRGSNGPEFADELFSSSPSSPPQPQPAQHPEKEKEKEKKTNLATHLPQTRWVFPTTKTRWDTRFQEESPAWFDVYSLTDIEARSELQVDELRESVDYVLRILEAEVALLDGDARRVVLGGMSMGMATALWALLGSRSRISTSSSGRAGGRLGLGGFLGFCGWFPFAGVAERLLGSGCARGQDRELVSTVLGDSTDDNSSSSSVPDNTIPVLLLHGTDDAFVSVDLGRQAARVVEMSGMFVQWHEYDGADNDGHWIKEPEGFDRILEFVGGIASNAEPSRQHTLNSYLRDKNS